MSFRSIFHCLALITLSATAASSQTSGISSSVEGYGLENPSGAIGLNRIADFSTQMPFIDLMKSARPWVGHTAEQWGAMEEDAVRSAGVLDTNGWPTRIPDGIKVLEAVVLADIPAEASYFSGNYVVRYEGTGIIRMGGSAENVKYDIPGKSIRFSYQSGRDLLSIRISETDPKDNIRNVTIVREDLLPLFEAGQIFYPEWLNIINDFRIVRFMDWIHVNNSKLAKWEDRPTLETYSWADRGVPIEVIVDLANEIGADPWINIPHLADDEFVANTAAYVHEHLNSDLHVYAEYSNELWNFMFEQTQWTIEQAKKRWGDDAGGDAFIQFSGVRAAEVANIWATIFADERDRLINVITPQTGWPGLEEPYLEAPLYVQENTRNQPPYKSFDAYGLTGYFGFSLGEDSFAETIRDWTVQSRLAAETKAAQLSDNVADQNTYAFEHRFDKFFENAARHVANVEMKELFEQIYPLHIKSAQKYGLELIMYEGGTHTVGSWELVNDPEFTMLFTEFNYSPQMGKLYQIMMDKWEEMGGQFFNAFVDVAKPGQWGSWGNLRHLRDSTVRWDLITERNKKPSNRFAKRASSAFLHGVVYTGDDYDNTIEGTKKTDTLLGMAGNDILVSNGGNDRLDGGDGTDRAILPGSGETYRFEQHGESIYALRDKTYIRLRNVELVSFSDDPESIYSIAQ